MNIFGARSAPQASPSDDPSGSANPFRSVPESSFPSPREQLADRPAQTWFDSYAPASADPGAAGPGHLRESLRNPFASDEEVAGWRSGAEELFTPAGPRPDDGRTSPVEDAGQRQLIDLAALERAGTPVADGVAGDWSDAPDWSNVPDATVPSGLSSLALAAEPPTVPNATVPTVPPEVFPDTAPHRIEDLRERADRDGWELLTGPPAEPAPVGHGVHDRIDHDRIEGTGGHAVDAFGRLVMMDLSTRDAAVPSAPLAPVAPVAPEMRVIGGDGSGPGYGYAALWEQAPMPPRRRSTGRIAMVVACVAATLGVGAAVVVTSMNAPDAFRVELGLPGGAGTEGTGPAASESGAATPGAAAAAGQSANVAVPGSASVAPAPGRTVELAPVRPPGSTTAAPRVVAPAPRTTAPGARTPVTSAPRASVAPRASTPVAAPSASPPPSSATPSAEPTNGTPKPRNPGKPTPTPDPEPSVSADPTPVVKEPTRPSPGSPSPSAVADASISVSTPARSAPR